MRLGGWRGQVNGGTAAPREAARRYFDERLLGVTVEREDIGPIRISKRGADKTLSTMADPVKARLVPAITAVLRSGRLVNTTEADGKEARVRRYHYITAPVMLDGSRLMAGVTVEERADGKLYYNIMLISTQN